MTYRTANSAVQGDLCGVRSPYGTVLGGGYGVAHESVVWHDDDLLDEGLDEGPTLGQLALL